MTANEAARSGRIAPELAAIGLWAIAAYAFISLASFDAGWSPNLGGPIGAALAEELSDLIGFQSYVVITLSILLGRRLWPKPPVASGRGSQLVLAVVGGGLLIAALCTGVALVNDHGGGVTGNLIAAQLREYLNVGGGYIAVTLALIAGVALIAGRAPTDLAAAIGAHFRSAGAADTNIGDGNDAASAAPLINRLESSRIEPSIPLVKQREGSIATPTRRRFCTSRMAIRRVSRSASRIAG